MIPRRGFGLAFAFAAGLALALPAAAAAAPHRPPVHRPHPHRPLPHAGPPRHGRAPDARLRTVDDDEDRVVTLAGAPGVATEVVFAPGEHVAHVALGDSASWEVAVDDNLLFLKPRGAAHPSNLIVTTSLADGGRRDHVFELSVRRRSAGRAAGRSGPAYVLRFRGRRPATAPAVQRQALAVRQVALQLGAGAAAGPRNLAYSEQGPAALAPAEVSDNGRFTELRFPGGQPLPAIYVVGPTGEEALARFTVRGDRVVVEGVHPALRLRRGRGRLCLWNDAYHPAAAAGAGSLTASPAVVRTDLRARP